MVQLTQNHPHINLRVKFKKIGSLQYISHLDLVRTMQKIVTRAGLPLWYTEGFNPIPKMTFAAPLSIGTESLTEFVDIKLVDDMPPDEIIRRLNLNMTDEMQVIDAYYTDDKLTELKWLTYRITIVSSGDLAELLSRCRGVLCRESIMVEKKAPKPGETPKMLDIKPLIHSASVELSERGEIVVDAILSADSSSFLNPEYVVKALRAYAGVHSSGDLLRERHSILRISALKADMTPFV